MSGPRKVLVVGGGVAGMSAAIALCRGGWDVDLIDLDPEWRVYGAGITLTGPTLRALQQLGVFEAVAAHAYVGDGIDVCTVDGTVTGRVETPVPVGSTAPGSGGVLRPVLHRILAEAVRAAGCRVRLGLTVRASPRRPMGCKPSSPTAPAAPTASSSAPMGCSRRCAT